MGVLLPQCKEHTASSPTTLWQAYIHHHPQHLCISPLSLFIIPIPSLPPFHLLPSLKSTGVSLSCPHLLLSLSHPLAAPTLPHASRQASPSIIYIDDASSLPLPYFIYHPAALPQDLFLRRRPHSCSGSRHSSATEARRENKPLLCSLCHHELWLRESHQSTRTWKSTSFMAAADILAVSIDVLETPIFPPPFLEAAKHSRELRLFQVGNISSVVCKSFELISNDWAQDCIMKN